MKLGLATIAVALAVLLLAVSQAGAQGKCYPRPQAIAALTEQYSESRRSIGLASQGRVMELWASEGGSWTITVTMPNGMTCLVASGQAFEQLDEALEPAGSRL